MSNIYTIHTKSNGSVTATANLASPNAGVIGQRNTLTLFFRAFGGSKTYTSDYTISGDSTVRYADVTVDSDVTLTVDGTLYTHNLTVNGNTIVNGEIIVVDNFNVGWNTLLPYGEWAGKYETSRMLDGTLKYTDRIPSAESLDSLVVGIEPDAELKNLDVNGVWGIIDSIADARGPTLNTNRIDLSITVLAEYEDYTDHSQMENNLKL